MIGYTIINFAISSEYQHLWDDQKSFEVNWSDYVIDLWWFIVEYQCFCVYLLMRDFISFTFVKICKNKR